MFRRAKWLGVAVVVVAALGAAPAYAERAGTETFTEHAHQVLFEEKATENPCTGEPGTLTLFAKNQKFHATQQADGNYWITGTVNGSASFTPTNPEGVSFSGHFTLWFGEAANNKNKVEHDTGSYALTGTNGSTVHIHLRDHLSTNAKGEVTAEAHVFNVTCG